MGTIQEFEATLKEAVRGKRLSASKMAKTTDIALSCMENDAKLVSIMYRTHKTLAPACKVSGLYAFDALARAARSYANKHKQASDPKSDKGNCATFLLKMEGVLDGLFKDMLSLRNEEAKEKTKKVLDIWLKANTFPPAVLTRLSDMVEGKGQEPGDGGDAVPTQTPPTPAQPTPPAIPTSGPTAEGDAGATLLALIEQVQSAVGTNGQAATNTGGFSGPHLEELQSALLRQLAQNNQPSAFIPPAPQEHQNSHSPFPQTHGPSPAGPYPYAQAPQLPQNTPWVPPNVRPGPPFVNSASVDPRAGPPGPPLPRPPAAGHRDSWQDAQFGGGGGGGGQPDPRYGSTNHRGDFRGGFRGRGRGRFDASADRMAGARVRESRSRSRSPPRSRYGAGRDARPYSPPRRPPAQDYARNDFPASAPAVGKDEFGRDIRPDASDPGDGSDDDPREAVTKDPRNKSNTTTPPAQQLVVETPAVETPAVPPPPAPIQGLDMFNVATFDFTSPASWEALGKMWQVTNGYLPTQEALMQFVMSGGQLYAPTATQGHPSPASGAFQPFGGAADAAQGVDQWDVQQRQTAAQNGAYGAGGQGGTSVPTSQPGGRGRGMGRGNLRDGFH